MKFIFFGTPEFAAAILKKLLNADLPPSAVVTNPDRPVGRKKIITAPPVKKLITENSQPKTDIRILQPENPVTIRDTLIAFRPDLLIVAAYAKILPKEILAIPRLAAIGIHPSLLPRYRGASPIQSAILAGESETGISLYIMDEKADHGPVIATRRLPLENSETYETLEKKLAELGGDLLIETLQKFSEGMIHPAPQDESHATYTKKFATEDGLVPLELLEQAEKNGGPPAFEIDRKIRALNPEPGVYTMRDGKRIKLLEARIENEKLVLVKIQREGGKSQQIVS